MEENSQAKIEAYFYTLESHIFKPIEEKKITSSCYATLFLLFTIIDSMGRLTDENEKAEVGIRFKNFLSKMGDQYHSKRNEIWILRNEIIHNGLASLSFLSETLMAEGEHLKYFGNDRLIFVQTIEFFKDLKNTYNKEKESILNDPQKIEEFGKRLQWQEEPTFDYFTDRMATPPPNICFISFK